MLTKEKHLTAHERHTGGSGFVRLAAAVIGDHVLEVTNKCYLNTLSGIISNQKHVTTFSPLRASPRLYLELISLSSTSNNLPLRAAFKSETQ